MERADNRTAEKYGTPPGDNFPKSFRSKNSNGGHEGNI